MDQVSLKLPAELHQKIHLRALQEGESEAVVMRQALERGLAEPTGREHPLQALIDLHLTGGPVDLSANLDDYLYGDKE